MYQVYRYSDILARDFESVYSLQETHKNIYDIVFSGDNAFTSVRFILCVTHKVN